MCAKQRKDGTKLPAPKVIQSKLKASLDMSKIKKDTLIANILVLDMKAIRYLFSNLSKRYFNYNIYHIKIQ